jgi:large subunit ribosomal protein L32
MSICPKGKMSKSKRDKRKAQSWKIAMPNLVKCDRCGELMMPHRVCKSCGSYNKKTVVAVD